MLRQQKSEKGGSRVGIQPAKLKAAHGGNQEC